MSDRQQRQARAAKEAATWLLRLGAGDLSSHARAEFVDWLRDSPVHIAEMLRIARLRSSLTRFDKWEQLPSPPESSDDVEISDEARVDGRICGPRSAGVPSHLHEPIAPRKLQWGLAAAAAIAVLATSIGLYWFTSTPSVIRTQLGERREMSLPDGSVVAVSPGSEIRVLFDAKQRLVILNHGQAYFQVGKDPNRPFLVDAASGWGGELGNAPHSVSSNCRIPLSLRWSRGEWL
jgi:transmembrane sensor